MWRRWPFRKRTRTSMCPRSTFDQLRGTAVSPVDTLVLLYDNCGETSPLPRDRYVRVAFRTVEGSAGNERLEHYVVHIFSDGTIVFIEDGEPHPAGRTREVEGQRGAAGFAPSARCAAPHVIAEYRIRSRARRRPQLFTRPAVLERGCLGSAGATGRAGLVAQQSGGEPQPSGAMGGSWRCPALHVPGSERGHGRCTQRVAQRLSASRPHIRLGHVRGCGGGRGVDSLPGSHRRRWCPGLLAHGKLQCREFGHRQPGECGSCLHARRRQCGEQRQERSHRHQPAVSASDRPGQGCPLGTWRGHRFVADLRARPSQAARC